MTDGTKQGWNDDGTRNGELRKRIFLLQHGVERHRMMNGDTPSSTGKVLVLRKTHSKMLESVLCILDLSVAPIYLCLGLIAMSSVMIKPLQQLAAHGKTKETMDGSAASEAGTCKPTNQGNIRRHTRVVEGTNTHDTSWKKRLVIALGALMLGLVGQYEQHLHHVILANLRKRANQTTISRTVPSKSSGETKGNHYAIPIGRGFDYVSCPHYLAEICIYISFYLLLGHNHNDGLQFESLVELLQKHQATILLFWVTVNLTISAQGSHQWYTRQTRLQDNKSHAITPAVGSKKAIFPSLF
eukprot:scaffold4890_cov57-Attheya_sp.AAC.1